MMAAIALMKASTKRIRKRRLLVMRLISIVCDIPGDIVLLIVD